MNTNLKFVTVDLGAFGKQSSGGIFQYSALYQSLETPSLKFPEDTFLPNSEITLPHIFVGGEAHPLANLLNETIQQKYMKQK